MCASSRARTLVCSWSFCCQPPRHRTSLRTQVYAVCLGPDSSNVYAVSAQGILTASTRSPCQIYAALAGSWDARCPFPPLSAQSASSTKHWMPQGDGGRHCVRPAVTCSCVGSAETVFGIGVVTAISYTRRTNTSYPSSLSNTEWDCMQRCLPSRSPHGKVRRTPFAPSSMRCFICSPQAAVSG